MNIGTWPIGSTTTNNVVKAKTSTGRSIARKHPP
jgi:hypothetical protein